MLHCDVTSEQADTEPLCCTVLTWAKMVGTITIGMSVVYVEFVS